MFIFYMVHIVWCTPGPVISFLFTQVQLTMKVSIYYCGTFFFFSCVCVLTYQYNVCPVLYMTWMQQLSTMFYWILDKKSGGWTSIHALYNVWPERWQCSCQPEINRMLVCYRTFKRAKRTLPVRSLQFTTQQIIIRPHLQRIFFFFLNIWVHVCLKCLPGYTYDICKLHLGLRKIHVNAV